MPTPSEGSRFRMNRKQRAKLFRLHTEWYGEDRAIQEATAHTNFPIAMSELVEGVLKKATSSEHVKLTQVADKWEEIVGAQLARVCYPQSVEYGILKIAVTNSVWLSELRMTMKPILLKKIHAACGEKLCRDIEFTISGKR